MVGKAGNMKVEYDPDFIRRLKKLNARIRKSFRERIAIFQKDPFSPELDNHDLHDKWEGYRRIDITSD
jgi:mRNA-degrading endonuclease RelE of RelBE toxin-antitoxin system